MILGSKARLFPGEEQEKALWRSAGTARFVYNWTLARQEENYNNAGTLFQWRKVPVLIWKIRICTS